MIFTPLPLRGNLLPPIEYRGIDPVLLEDRLDPRLIRGLRPIVGMLDQVLIVLLVLENKLRGELVKGRYVSLVQLVVPVQPDT